MATAKKTGKRTATQKNPKPKVEEPEYLCPYCNETKKRSEFYVSTDPLVLTGVTHMCKDCAKKIALNYDEKTGEYGECTKFSIQQTLERLDKPYGLHVNGNMLFITCQGSNSIFRQKINR